MTDKQIEELANRLIDAINHLSPGDPSIWTIISSLAPVAALIAAGVVAVTGWLNLRHQQKALRLTVEHSYRSEWWKRTQWAIEASAMSDNDALNAAGTEMLKILAMSGMVQEEDLNLLDTGWRAVRAAVDEESAEEFLREAAELANEEAAMDAQIEAGENEGTKEESDG